MASFGTESSNFNNEIIAVNPNNSYQGKVSVTPNVASSTGDGGLGRRFYCGHTFVDQSGRSISSTHHQHRGLAKLAQDLNLGTDDWMYIVRDSDFLGSVDPHTEWIMNSPTYALRRGPIFWDHHYPEQETGPDGNSIPFSRINEVGVAGNHAGFGYSRHYVYDLWAQQATSGGAWELANDGSGAGNWNGYTNVWRHPIRTDHGNHYGHSYSPNATATLVPEGTWLSQNYHGGTYKYCYAVGTRINNVEKFFRFEGWIGGIDYSGSNRTYNFPPGAAGAVWMMLACYASPTLGQKQHISAMSMSEDTNIDQLQVQYGAIPEHKYVRLRKMEVNAAGAASVHTVPGPRYKLADRYEL